MVFLEYCRVVVVALEMAIPKKTLKDKWTTYVHVWHKVVLFIGVDEERSNGEAGMNLAKNFPKVVQKTSSSNPSKHIRPPPYLDAEM